MNPEPLLPVGRDCDCGQPLVWRHGEQWCAIYGSHPVVTRLRTAYGNRLLELVMGAPNNTTRAIAARRRRAA